jgi:hypothetical protein
MNPIFAAPNSLRGGSATPRRLLIVQIVLSVAVIGWIPGNVNKAVCLLIVWILTFGKLDFREICVYAVVCALFTGMDSAAVARGSFQFTNPDFLGIPVWEIFMWGFYVLHTVRMLGGNAPAAGLHTSIPWALLVALPFMLISDPILLLAVSGVAFGLCICRFHEKLDLAYVAYMILLGAFVEYAGVWTGEWTYPGAPSGGVQPWFIVMWGAVGLFTRRLLLPFLTRNS